MIGDVGDVCLCVHLQGHGRCVGLTAKRCDCLLPSYVQ